MSTTRRFTRLVAAVLFVGVLCLPALAEDPLARPHAFDDGIQAIRALLDEGDCKAGTAALATLLEEHKGANYAKARHLEIEELTLHLACGLEHAAPKAKDLVSGDLKSWSPETGKLRIEYTPKTIADLESRDGLSYLPARLDGPFTLEIKGTSYPPDEIALPRIVLGGDQHPETGKDQTWRIEFGTLTGGTARKPAKVSATILHFDGDERNEVSQKTASANKPGRPYKLVVKVTKTKLSVTLDGRSLGSARKPASIYGYLGFRAENWTELNIKGTVDPGWIESKLDEVFRGQLLEFEKTYDPTKHVPDWLGEPLDKREVRRKGPDVDLIGRLGSKHYELYLDVQNEVRADEFENALKAVDTMQAAGVPGATCEYVRATIRERMAQLDPALVHIRRCVELEPAFMEGVLLHGSLLQQLGRFTEALAAFEAATTGNAEFARAYEEAASSMLMAGRPEDAKRATQMAARNGVTSEKLIALNDALAKVVRGPRWVQRYEHRSRNYHVMSNMDQLLCREAAKLLEEAFQEYRKTMGWVEEDRTRLFKVYLFKERAGFLGYQGDLQEFMGKPAEQAAGLYSPLLKQLLIWNLPDREDMLTTIRHEGFHQYLDRLMPNPPVWFNEGLAVYHENGKKIDGKLAFGQPHPEYVRLLFQRGFIPLKKFLEVAPPQFYEDGHRSYAQGWLLVHMLRHTTPAYLRLFDEMVEGLKTQSGYAVVQKAFPPDRLAQVEKDLRDYLQKLDTD